MLDSISPFALQANWDNSGLNIGSLSMPCKKVFISLELDWQVLNYIDESSLLIVHHPIIFKPLNTLDTDIYPSSLISKCLQKNISVVAMHTNFDLTHLNQAFANSIKLEELGFVLESNKEFSLIYANCSKQTIALDSIAKHIKNKLNLNVLRYSKGFDYLQNGSRIFITCGSNASSYCIASSNDCIITGDIKYHDAMIANSNHISFVDVPHFESEYIFATLLAEILQKKDIQAIIANSHNPFCYI